MISIVSLGETKNLQLPMINYLIRYKLSTDIVFFFYIFLRGMQVPK